MPSINWLWKIISQNAWSDCLRGHWSVSQSSAAGFLQDSGTKSLSLHEMRLGGTMRDAGRCLHSLLPVPVHESSHTKRLWEVEWRQFTHLLNSEAPWLQMTDSRYLHRPHVDLNFQSGLCQYTGYLFSVCRSTDLNSVC